MHNYFGNRKIKYYLGSGKVKKIYKGDQKVYSAGNWATYYIDTNDIKEEEIDEGLSVLNPSTFSPSKSDWTFHGWRDDTTATSAILTTKLMGDDPITIYCVFKQNIILSVYNNSTTVSQKSGYRYYNNGNVLNPTFSVTAATKSGWTFNGWCTSTGATDSITYSSISNRSFSSNTSVYARYSKNVTLSYNGNGSTSGSNVSQTGTAYYNSGGNTSSPTIHLQNNGFARTGYLFSDWALGSISGNRYTQGTDIKLSDNSTVYAIWNPITYYIAYNGNGSTSGSMSNSTHQYDTAKALTANAYTRNGYSFHGWATSTAGAVAYSNIQSVTNLTVTHGTTINLYAKWLRNAITLVGDTEQWVYGGDANGIAAYNLIVDCTDFNYLSFSVSGCFYSMYHPTTSEYSVVRIGLMDDAGKDKASAVVITTFWNSNMDNEIDEFRYNDNSPCKGWNSGYVDITLDISALSGNLNLRSWATNGVSPKWDLKIKNVKLSN